MRHGLGLFAAALLVVLMAGPPASAWMISQDEEQLDATAQTAVEWILKGPVFPSGGGKFADTNPFPQPNRTTFVGGGSFPNFTATGVRFFGVSGGSVPQSPGVKRQFGIFCEGPDVPAVLDKYWATGPTGSPPASTPSNYLAAASVSFAELGGGLVQVTVSNQSPVDIVVSEVGYRILKIDSFSLHNLNRVHMPPSTFTPVTLADSNLAAGESSSFVVAGVGYRDDVVVYLTVDNDPPVANVAPSGMWVAWQSGTYVPARKAYLGPVLLNAVNTGLSYGAAVLHRDLALKTPFDVITPVVGPSARFLPVIRVQYDPGYCVPNGHNPSGTGCNPAFGNAAKINANWVDQVLSTTNAAGVKLSYLRTAGLDVYANVRVKARIMPGASTTTTTVAASDDFGGPVAIRVQPTGGSYYASVVTGRKNQIDLRRDDTPPGGPISTAVLASATQWANGDPIALDHDVPAVVPAPDDPPTYAPKLYDVVLEAVGANITLTVTEVGNANHTVTLAATDSTFAEGYVGLRTERDGGLDYPSDPTGSNSIKFETIVREYVIENPLAAPTLKAAVLSNMELGIDDVAQDGGSLSGQRSNEVVNDTSIAQMLFAMGLGVDVLDVDMGIDSFSYVGAFADYDDPLGRFAPSLNGRYDLVVIPGGAAAAATKFGVPRLTMPLVVTENGVVGARRCDDRGSGGVIPAPPGDACGGTLADAGTGMTGGSAGAPNSNPGDWRGSGSSVWGGNQQEAPDAIRIRSAAEGGDPNHPVVAGLSDGTGTQQIRVYADPWRHMQVAGEPAGPGTVQLAIELEKSTGADGSVNNHPAWGLTLAEANTDRFWAVAQHAPNIKFPARHAFLWVGDAIFHRLTYVGREIARRSILWAMNQPIPTSTFIYYGDFDKDADVDLVDFGLFQGCFNGPNRPIAFENGCAPADADGDGDVDLADFGAFQMCFNGPNQAPATGCPVPQIVIP